MNYWIGTVSKEHVMRAVELGIAQLSHGKAAPLKRLKKNDLLIYYSPKISLGKKESCQMFTAIGLVADDNIYQYDMGNGFVPFRRTVDYFNCQEIAIAPLIEQLSFIKNKKYWGYVFRYGLIKIEKQDAQLIAQHMLTKDDYKKYFSS